MTSRAFNQLQAHQFARIAKMELHVRIFTLVSLMFLPMYSDGYPNGQVESACSTMMPSHGADAQSSLPPYTLSFSSVNHTRILGFRVTLSKEPSGTDFKGFMIQARPPGQNTPQGRFIVNSTDAQTLCTTAERRILAGKSDGGLRWMKKKSDDEGFHLETSLRAVSHTGANFKSSVSVIWLPPEKATTDIQFRATVVQVKNIFWTNVFSDVIPLAGEGSQLLAPALGQLVLCSTLLICALFTI